MRRLALAVVLMALGCAPSVEDITIYDVPTIRQLHSGAIHPVINFVTEAEPGMVPFNVEDEWTTLYEGDKVRVIHDPGPDRTKPYTVTERRLVQVVTTETLGGGSGGTRGAMYRGDIIDSQD